MSGAWAILLRKERAPQGGDGPEEPEVIGRDMNPLCLFRPVSSSQIDAGTPFIKRGNVLERLRLLAPHIELWNGRSGTGALWGAKQKLDDTIRLGKGQGPEQDRVDHRENSSVGTNAQGDSRDSSGGEAGDLTEHPQRMPDILKEAFHIGFRRQLRPKCWEFLYVFRPEHCGPVKGFVSSDHP